MMIFHVDLDNTLIFSYKHEIGAQKRCVEIYQGREVSFMTERTFRLLSELKKSALIVPTTTRTPQQYRRICLGVGEFPYALVCNGGILLENGREVESWYRESLRRIKDSRTALQKAVQILEKEPQRTLEVRLVSDLFVFTKCQNPVRAVERLRASLDTALVDVFHQGVKTYVIPKNLSKGHGVKRFRSYLKQAAKGDGADFAAGAEENFVVAAGDNPFDVSMIAEADLGITPKSLKGFPGLGKDTVYMPGNTIYSQEVLEYVAGVNEPWS